MNDHHLPTFFRELNEEAGELTRTARRDGSSSNSYQGEGKIEVIRIYLDGGVGHEEDKRIKHRVGAGWVLQVAECDCESQDHTWKTIVEVARALKDDNTTTDAELVAATEIVRAAVNLVRTGRIGFDLDGMLAEEGNQEGTEGTEKRKSKYTAKTNLML